MNRSGPGGPGWSPSWGGFGQQVFSPMNHLSAFVENPGEVSLERYARQRRLYNVILALKYIFSVSVHHDQFRFFI